MLHECSRAPTSVHNSAMHYRLGATAIYAMVCECAAGQRTRLVDYEIMHKWIVARETTCGVTGDSMRCDAGSVVKPLHMY